jgi:signal transduction histidine kinase
MQKRFSDLSRKCRSFIIAVWIAAATFLIFAMVSFTIPEHVVMTPGELFFWAAIVIVAESFLIILPVSGYLSIGTAIDISIILLFGPALASLYGILGALSSLIVRRAPFHKVLFNAAQFILTMGISAWVYHSLAHGVDFVRHPHLIAVFLLTILVYFGINSGLLSVVIGLSEGLSPKTVWVKNHSWTISYLFVLAAIGYLMVMVNFTLGKWAILVLLLPVILIRKAYRQYMDLKKMQDQLIQSERLAAVGQMVSGISHEIDNPISVIMGYSDYLLKKMPHDDARTEEIKTIREEAKRCRTIVREYLDFSKPKTRVETVDINSAVSNAISLLRHESASRKIEIVFKKGDGLPNMLGDMKKLEQVFINVMLNAFQAMTKGGHLSISTGVAKNPYQGDKALLERIWKKEKQGDVIQVVFQDTGCGIKKENLEQLFMPFFTTKSQEGGRGLGLFVSYQIIKEHRGSFDIKSDLGKGTVVTINLPFERGI